MSERNPTNIILASASPRRKQLLSRVGYKFRVVPPNIDESAFLNDSISPCEYAKTLALAKAKNVAAKFPNSLVIGADTVVDFDGRIIGKPTDAEQASRIIKKLFSKPHKIITALAIIRASDGTKIVESDITTVFPKKITPEQIKEHIKSQSWRDKAGAYAIKETGDEFIEKIQGSLTNVMGLPMELLQRLLKRFVD